MTIAIPTDVEKIIQTLNDAGFEAYAVGGCVRDSILGRRPHDWDITTSARPEEMKGLFRHTIDTGIEHGTVTVLLNRVGYEVTTYRIDGEYEDGRHPKEVTFTASLSEDLARRDFTINAMAYHPRLGLVDLYGGQEDLQKGIIRCVGNPIERFTEDALRMMRAVRFGAQLDFTVEEGTREAICTLAPTLERISAERIRDELIKLITSDHPEYLVSMQEWGLTRVFLPEFDAMMACDQHTVHHCYTVGMHTIVSMQQVEASPLMRLTMLLHDVAKPNCKVTDEKGTDHFYGHPDAGAEMAKSILRRLRMDNDSIAKICALVRFHDQRPELNIRSVRRAAFRMGSICFPEIFRVKVADTLAQSDYKRQEKLDAIEGFRQLYEQILEEKQPLSIKELAIDGRNLMDLGVPSGPLMGEILRQLLEECIEDPQLNREDQLTERALEIFQSLN